MSLSRRVKQVERKRGAGYGGVVFSAVFICELGGTGGKDETAIAKLLIGPHAGQDVTKTSAETYAEFKERVDKLLYPKGRTHAQRNSDVMVTIGGGD